MQSFLTIVLAAIGSFFAFAMMPAETEPTTELLAEEQPSTVFADTTATPVILLESVQPLVLALDETLTYEEMLEFDLQALSAQVD